MQAGCALAALGSGIAYAALRALATLRPHGSDIALRARHPLRPRRTRYSLCPYLASIACISLIPLGSLSPRCSLSALRTSRSG